MVSFVGHEDNNRSVLDLGFLCLYDFSPKPVAVGLRSNFVVERERSCLLTLFNQPQQRTIR
jgi:hypothetical protein